MPTQFVVVNKSKDEQALMLSCFTRSTLVEPVGQCSTGDVVPHAEDGPGNGGEGIGGKVERGKAAGQS